MQLPAADAQGRIPYLMTVPVEARSGIRRLILPTTIGYRAVVIDIARGIAFTAAPHEEPLAAA